MSFGTFAEPTAYGFEVPGGSPGELDAAASGCARCAHALAAQSAKVNQGLGLALTGWEGLAQEVFAGIAESLGQSYDRIGGIADAAGSVLRAFGQELEIAQTLTKRALAECERAAGAVAKSGQDAAEHAATAQACRAQAAGPVTPQRSLELGLQAGEAEAQQGAAELAQQEAQADLDHAKSQGARAWQEYEDEAKRASARLQALGAEITAPRWQLHDSGGSVQLTGDESKSGSWQETAEDSVLGTLENVLKRYRRVIVVKGKDARETEAALAYIMRNGESGAKDLYKDLDIEHLGFLTAGEKDLESLAPDLTDMTGKAVGGVGSILSFSEIAHDTWDEDNKKHPHWSEFRKELDTVQKTIVVGGLSTVFAGLGGEAGEDSGMAVGGFFFDAPGAVLGAIGGAVGGAELGAWGGKEIGEGLEDLGGDTVKDAEYVGHEAEEGWHEASKGLHEATHEGKKLLDSVFG